MRAFGISSSAVLAPVLLIGCCTGCHGRKAAAPPQQAQAPALQTGGTTLAPPKSPQPQEKSASPLASPLPPPSAQSVALPPPPPLKKVRHRVKATKPVETAQAGVPSSSGVAAGSQAGNQAAPQPPKAASPIGQLTTGDTALGERTKHETADLIGATQQGLNGIKRPLSTDEKVTATQIKTFLRQAQQELDNGDSDGAHTLATKARLLLDELTKP